MSFSSLSNFCLNSFQIRNFSLLISDLVVFWVFFCGDDTDCFWPRLQRRCFSTLNTSWSPSLRWDCLQELMDKDVKENSHLFAAPVNVNSSSKKLSCSGKNRQNFNHSQSSQIAIIPTVCFTFTCCSCSLGSLGFLDGFKLGLILFLFRIPFLPVV